MARLFKAFPFNKWLGFIYRTYPYFFLASGKLSVSKYPLPRSILIFFSILIGKELIWLSESNALPSLIAYGLINVWRYFLDVMFEEMDH